jgi:uncharacterized protein (DUF697 family)/uncharacterized tellurite resistance protein B-like protein
MTRDEQQALLVIALTAAFADGRKDERERAEIRSIVDALAAAGEPNLPALYRQVLLGQAPLDTSVAALADPALRRLAYEMAVGVCDADGARGDAETRFLADLQRRLGLDPAQAEAIAAHADRLAEAPLDTPVPVPVPLPPAPAHGPAGRPAGAGAPAGVAIQSAPGAAPPAPQRPSTLSEAELEQAIRSAAILNGALELLPDSLATMAIIPLQLKLVYRIGQSYGYELDRGHAREFLATVGVGLTSQYLEQAATRLVGGLLRAVGGGLLGGLGRQAASSAMSFASTWALGQVARRYYAGGRTLDEAALREAFAGLLGEAKQLQAQYLPQIEAQARSLDLPKLLQSLRA